MTVQRQRLGRLAEDLVAARLATTHWEILERNARTRYGELDIVALDDRTLVFVEVKAGRENATFGPERPVVAVDRRKQLQVRRLATTWMIKNRGAVHYDQIRFDAIGVTFDHSGHLRNVEHIENAF